MKRTSKGQKRPVSFGIFSLRITDLGLELQFRRCIRLKGISTIAGTCTRAVRCSGRARSS
jgi:hypothetical protein